MNDYEKLHEMKLALGEYDGTNPAVVSGILAAINLLERRLGPCTEVCGNLVAASMTARESAGKVEWVST